MPIAGLFDPYILLLTLIGGLILAAAGLPRLIRELPLSVPMILLLLGGVDRPASASPHRSRTCTSTRS